MLILTRKQDEVIYVGDSIRVKIVGVSSGKVRILIDAPQDMPIRREELAPLRDKS